MDGKTLEQAFEEMINTRGIYKRLGRNVNTVKAWRSLMRQGKGISREKMRELLEVAGWRVVQVELWREE